MLDAMRDLVIIIIIRDSKVEDRSALGRLRFRPITPLVDHQRVRIGASIPYTHAQAGRVLVVPIIIVAIVVVGLKSIGIEFKFHER